MDQILTPELDKILNNISVNKELILSNIGATIKNDEWYPLLALSTPLGIRLVDVLTNWINSTKPRHYTSLTTKKCILLPTDALKF